ncbi:hypothetical protein NKR23_g5749 [Pleurostoma richardsiae]|uniref:Uncharacterized protein n=1 Tax=Pleurostoma richardsiae TaxID=41990 RepID=A0AA38RFS9_9PEZI|nr:hypothetical protein NKR23_g5749 [Pleurostoma richardsiae]
MENANEKDEWPLSTEPSPTPLAGKSHPVEYSLPWTDKKAGSHDEPPASTSKYGFLRYSLGLLGLATVLGGTVTILAVMAFITFLWTGEGEAGGESAPALWRWIMLQQFITQAITLSTVLMRIAITAQASIYTSMVAAVMLEKHGVPLSRVAEVSVIRSSNDGPFRLAWLLLKSARKSAIQSILIVVLLLTAVATQFSSTILVSDLDFSDLVDDPGNETLPVYMTREVISLNHQVNNWLGRPTAYVPFGEVQSAADTSPTSSGLSDTGVMRRVFLPVSQAQRSTLRRYVGNAFGFSSRFVCMRPSMDAVLTGNVLPPFTAYIAFYLSISGNISYEQTFADAGMNLPANCPRGSCFPRSFNCSLPQFQYPETQARQGFAVGMCLMDGDSVASSAANSTLSDEPIPNYAEVFLYFRTNGTYDLWSGPNSTYLSGNFGLPNVSSTDGEWITYDRSIGGRLQNGTRIEKGVFRLDVSMCFQQVAFDFSEVEVSSARDLSEPTVAWDPAKKAWDTEPVRKMLGVSQPNLTLEDRGIFSVESIRNSQHLNASQFFTNKLINNLYNSPNVRNVSLFMDTQGSGRSSFLPHVEYQALFGDTLNTTGRPGVAMQATLTALSGSFINEAIPQFDADGNATVTSSTLVLTPRRLRGLLAVAGTVAVNMAAGFAIAAVFLRGTRYSSQGNYWHAVAQIVSEHTTWILEDSTRLSDDVVEERLNGIDPEVRIAQSSRTGRVQVVMTGYK